MRLRHGDGSTVHLAYCTNVHPAETLDGVLAQLRDHCAPVRRRLDRERLGIGLWLARPAATALTSDPSALHTLREALTRHGLEVVTLNGFPYAGFGDRHVKYHVYRPDWHEPERLAYTTDLADLLAALLPDDVTEGTISTLPLGWRTRYTTDDRTVGQAHDVLTALTHHVDDLEERTGKSIRIALEPEPGCVIETPADAVPFLSGLPGDRIGVCLDTCHLATSFQDPDAAIDTLSAAGVTIPKAQLSTALHAEHPHRPDVRQALAAYSEPRFLHQTRVRTAGRVRGTDDLAQALEPGGLPDSAPWRAHFHMPLHAPPPPPLASTLPVLEAALTRLVGGPAPLTRHLEVETYTWETLPGRSRPRSSGRLADGIAAELVLARDLLTGLGLKELP